MGSTHSVENNIHFATCKENFDIYWNGKNYKLGYNGNCPVGYNTIKEKLILNPSRQVYVTGIKGCMGYTRYYEVRFSPIWANVNGTVWMSSSEYKKYWRQTPIKF